MKKKYCILSECFIQQHCQITECNYWNSEEYRQKLTNQTKAQNDVLDKFYADIEIGFVDWTNSPLI